MIGDTDFIEVHMKCPLPVCEMRDVKGVYQKARAGLIKEFTGISSPYEEPEAPELIIDSSRLNLEESVTQVVELLRSRGILQQITS